MAQQTGYVDFKTNKANLALEVDSRKVIGNVDYVFEILKDVDSIYLDAVNMQFDGIDLSMLGVHVDTEIVGFHAENNTKELVVYNDFKKGEIYQLQFDYSVTPQKALYFVQKDDYVQVWTQGQGKYTSHWLPSLDDTNDKIEFDVSITCPSDYQVVSNGKLTDKQINDTTATWHYDMQNPMSSYLVALVAGKYGKKVAYSKSGIPLELYYYPGDSLKVEPTYRYTKQIFDFLEQEIGVPYPWQNYKQVPVHDFLYAGMENTSCTIFSDAFMIDDIGFVDKNYVNVNAHELAHQWFGDLVTAKSGEHHWLQEGFATYYALLAERQVFGADYYFWQLYEYAQELLEQDRAGQSTSLLNPKSSSLTFYKKGAWVLHMLKEKVGERAFKSAVKNYLETHRFGNVETNDFIDEVEKASGMDLNSFVSLWLESKDLPFEIMMNVLKKDSESIKLYLETDCQSLPFICKQMIENIDDKTLKIKILNKIPVGLIPKSFFDNQDVKFRQALASKLTYIPMELKQEYEGLLDDDSYITKEIALYNLWNNFPEDRAKYLDKTKNSIGFNNKNLRMLWLVLAMATPEYQPENSQDYYEELVGYTNPEHAFETRMRAFEYLLMTNACHTRCQNNLEDATKHHNWRLAKFAKDQLKRIKRSQE